MSGPNVSAITFAANEGSYLAGAAAALESTTGTIGFIGGVDMDVIWQFQAGFEAGAREVDPDVRILDTYLAEPPRLRRGLPQRRRWRARRTTDVRARCRRDLRRGRAPAASA